MLTQVLLYGLRSVQLAFSVVSVLLVSRVFTGFLPSHTAMPVEPPAKQEAPVVERQQLSEYEKIGTIDLFRAKEVKPPKVEEAPVEQTQLQVRLFGTMAGTTPALSIAVIQNMTTNRFDIARIGDPVAQGQAKVVRIEPRRVLVDHDGRLEAIEIEEKKPIQSARVIQPPSRGKPGAGRAKDRGKPTSVIGGSGKSVLGNVIRSPAGGGDGRGSLSIIRRAQAQAAEARSAAAGSEAD